MRTSYGVGRYIASESDVLMFPKGYKGGGTIRGAIYMHGIGELSTSAIAGSTANKQYEAAIMRAIASVYPTVAVDLGTWNAGGVTDSNHWGSTNAQTRVGQAKTWLQAPIGSGGIQNPAGGGAKAGSFAAVGISAGHALSLTYGQANAANLSCILGLLPVNDLDDIRDNDRNLGGGSLGYQEGISTAWAAGTQLTHATCTVTSGSSSVTDASFTTAMIGQYVTGPGIPINTFAGPSSVNGTIALSSSPTSQTNVNATASGSVTLYLTTRWTAAGTPALPAAANPAKTANQTNLLSIPQLLLAANDDTICTIATANTLTANIGSACQLINMGNSGGHSDTSLGVAYNTYLSQIMGFLAAHNV